MRAKTKRARVTVFLATPLLIGALVAAVPASAAPHAQPPAKASTGAASSAKTAGRQLLTVPRASRAAARTALAARTETTGTTIRRVDSDVSADTGSATLHITVHGAPAAVSVAVRAVGGQVLAASADAVSAVIPSRALSRLAARSGVVRISRAVRAFTDGVISQGVQASGANTWQTASITGSGVKVGIVDGGFEGLADEVTAGNLPAGLTVAGNHCADVNDTEHGTAVTEIVHQMAPDAQLFLYCVDDQIGFQTAETELQSAGVTIVNSSLGFPGDSRGDGTGSADSTATTVETARKAGILWVQSAGNNGLDHWGGTLKRDPVNKNLAQLDAADSVDDSDDIEVPPNADSEAVLQWDGWPTSTLKLQLLVQQFDPDSGDAIGNPIIVTHTSGTAPTIGVDLSNPSTTDPIDYAVAIGVPSTGTVPAIRYDLSYWGDVSYSYYAETYPTAAGTGESITEPASSPYVLAAGAADAGASGTCDPNPASAAKVENYSSRGPTIDGRVKPDILGYDGTAANLTDENPFCGTSAAAPHVAGAAALVSSANPTMDASQLESFLEDRAGTAAPTDTNGHGLLKLGATTGIVPRAGVGYTPLATPTRVLDTRTTTGGHHGALGAGKTVTVHPGVPAGATAVAINLTGTQASGSTHLSAYPGSVVPTTSNLNLSATDTTAAVAAVVTLASNGTITIRNATGTVQVVVDVVGYFSAASPGKYTALTPQRILDTRNGTGGHTGKLADGQTVSVQVGAGVTAAVINVTSTQAAAAGHFSVSPTGSGATSTLNFTKYDRANMAIVDVASDGTIKLRASGGPADAIVDLLGTFSPTGTSEYVALPAPVRVVDTRSGNGGRHTPFGAAARQSYYAAGVGQVPYTASALLTSAIAVSTVGPSYVQLYPLGSTRPNVSTLNVTTGRIVPNAAIVKLHENSFDVYNNSGSTAVIVDVFGYFD